MFNLQHWKRGNNIFGNFKNNFKPYKLPFWPFSFKNIWKFTKLVVLVEKNHQNSKKNQYSIINIHSLVSEIDHLVALCTLCINLVTLSQTYCSGTVILALRFFYPLEMGFFYWDVLMLTSFVMAAKNKTMLYVIDPNIWL